MSKQINSYLVGRILKMYFTYIVPFYIKTRNIYYVKCMHDTYSLEIMLRDYNLTLTKCTVHNLYLVKAILFMKVSTMSV